eukprot:1684499-Rhodomonas_salina.1
MQKSRRALDDSRTLCSLRSSLSQGYSINEGRKRESRVGVPHLKASSLSLGLTLSLFLESHVTAPVLAGDTEPPKYISAGQLRVCQNALYVSHETDAACRATSHQ